MEKKLYYCKPNSTDYHLPFFPTLINWFTMQNECLYGKINSIKKKKINTKMNELKINCY